MTRALWRMTLMTMLLLALALGGRWILDLSTGEASPEVVIGVDADPSGNTATSLASIEPCRSVAMGDTFDIDVFVAGVQDLIVWHVFLRYDPSVVNIIDRDVYMFLAAAPGSEVRDHSYGDPGLSGAYDLLASDVADDPPHESGSGVLARLTLTAVGTGTTAITVDDPLLWRYPLQPIAVESVANARIAVDGQCPDEPPDQDGDGFSDEEERYIGTDPLDSCTDGPGDYDAWPPDIGGPFGPTPDTSADILDVLLYKPKLLSNLYDARYDLDLSGAVNVVDVLLYKPVIMTHCTNP